MKRNKPGRKYSPAIYWEAGNAEAVMVADDWGEYMLAKDFFREIRFLKKRIFELDARDTTQEEGKVPAQAPATIPQSVIEGSAK